MKRQSKRITTLILIATLLLSMFSVNAANIEQEQEQVSSNSGVQDKINSIVSVYPTGSYFTASGNVCYSNQSSDCQLSNIPSRGGLPSGATAARVTKDAWSCCSFARYVFYCTFGLAPESCGTVNSSNAQVGDYINFSSHYAIYLGQDSTYWYVYDSNYTSPPTNIVKYNRALRKSNFSSVTIYHASNYDTINNPGNNPTGCVDEITGGIGTVKVKGWAFDVDNINSQLNIHVYIGSSADDPNAEGVGWITANTYRPDVENTYGCGGYHGYDVTIPTTKTGIQTVYVYAINIGSGNNVLIGSGVVNINPDTEKPVIQRTYLSEITNDSYRVCVVSKDNVGIKNVKVATWTKEDQSDIIWHNCFFNGYETYFIDLNRSDYSNVSNSFYNNHIYVYDYAGNYNSVALNMDYKVNSDTGKTIYDGEYRIVTAVDLNKAIDIDCGQSTNGTNIQIYSNLNEPNQTFDIKYIDNGLYTIISHSNGKSIDVQYDTYLPGTNVVLSQFHNGANQQWIIKPKSDGYYNIVAHSNGLALDVAGGNNENKTNVQVYSLNDTPAQKWKFRRVIKPEMVNVKNVIIKSNNIILNPKVQIIVDNNTLVLNHDYKVEVKSDIEKGTGTVTVTGIGNYCDSVTKSFDINPCEIGDVNLDGVINVNDVTALQLYISQSTEFTDEQKMLADYNQDGIIDVLDVTDIQQLIANS